MTSCSNSNVGICSLGSSERVVVAVRPGAIDQSIIFGLRKSFDP
jgi:hypothetical protein